MNQLTVNKKLQRANPILAWVSKFTTNKPRRKMVTVKSPTYIRDFIESRNSKLGKQLEDIEYEIYTRNQAIYLLTINTKDDDDGTRK